MKMDESKSENAVGFMGNSFVPAFPFLEDFQSL